METFLFHQTSWSNNAWTSRASGRQTKGPILYLVFCPRTRPKTFQQCLALDSRCSKAKHSKMS